MGEHSLKNGVFLAQKCPSFHTLLAIRKTPISAFFSSHDPILPPNHKFLKILSPKASKLGKSSIPKPQTGLRFSSHDFILLRNSVHKGPKFGNGPFISSAVRSSVANSICQEGQSDKTFPIFAFSSSFLLFFPNFSWFPPLFPDFWQLFCCQGWHSAPLAPPVATPLAVRPFGLHTFTKMKVECPLASICYLYPYVQNLHFVKNFIKKVIPWAIYSVIHLWKQTIYYKNCTFAGTYFFPTFVNSIYIIELKIYTFRGFKGEGQCKFKNPQNQLLFSNQTILYSYDIPAVTPIVNTLFAKLKEGPCIFRFSFQKNSTIAEPWADITRMWVALCEVLKDILLVAQILTDMGFPWKKLIRWEKPLVNWYTKCNIKNHLSNSFFAFPFHFSHFLW